MEIRTVMDIGISELWRSHLRAQQSRLQPYAHQRDLGGERSEALGSEDDEPLRLGAGFDLAHDVKLGHVDDRHGVRGRYGHEAGGAVAGESDVGGALTYRQASDLCIGFRVEDRGERVG